MGERKGTDDWISQMLPSVSCLAASKRIPVPRAVGRKTMICSDVESSVTRVGEHMRRAGRAGGEERRTLNVSGFLAISSLILARAAP